MSDMDGVRQSLVDVRNAYRLLALYQRHVKGTISAIGEGLGMTSYVWQPTFSHRPDLLDGKVLTHSSWNELPLFDASFLFLPPKAAGNLMRPTDWMLDVRLTSDSAWTMETTGHFGRLESASRSGWVDPADFDPANLTASFLTIFAGQPLHERHSVWHREWKSARYPEVDTLNDDVGDKGIWRAYGKRVVLEALLTAEQIDEVVATFRQELTTHKFPVVASPKPTSVS